MKTCLLCSKPFANTIVSEGRTWQLYTRKFCTECSPLNGRNNKLLHLQPPDGMKLCPGCKVLKRFDDFHPSTDYVCASVCKVCLGLRLKSRRKTIKEQCIAYKGGACQVCGYDRLGGALDFHHTEPSQKAFGIAKYNRTFERLKPELDKCVLVCCRCHREIEAGLIPCPPLDPPRETALACEGRGAKG